MGFYWSLSDCKSPQVSRTLLTILPDLYYTVACTVSTRSDISKFFSRLVTVPWAPIGIIVTFMFCGIFLNSFPKLKHWSLLSHSFNSTLWVAGTAKGSILQVLSFLLIIMRSGCQAEIRWSVCISKSQRSMCVSYSRTDSWFCMYHLFVWSNFNFWHNSLWITLPTRSCLVAYFFCPNLLHSLII